MRRQDQRLAGHVERVSARPPTLSLHKRDLPQVKATPVVLSRLYSKARGRRGHSKAAASWPLPVDRHLVGRHGCSSREWIGPRTLYSPAQMSSTTAEGLLCQDHSHPRRPHPRCQHSLVCKCQHTNTCPSLRPVHSQLRHGMLPSVLCPGQGWPVPHSDFSGAGRSEERAPVFTALTSPGWAGWAREAQGPGRSCASCWGNQVWRKHRGSGLR